MHQLLRNAAIFLPTTALLTFGGLTGAFADDTMTGPGDAGMSSSTSAPMDISDPSNGNQQGFEDAWAEMFSDENIEKMNERMADEYDTAADVPTTPGTQEQIDSVFTQINAARADKGLTPVKYSVEMSKVTQDAVKKTSDVNMSADPRVMVKEFREMLEQGLPEGHTAWGNADHGSTKGGLEGVADLDMMISSFATNPDVTHVGIGMLEYDGKGDGGMIEMTPEMEKEDFREYTHGVNLTVTYAVYPEDAAPAGSFDTVAEAFEAPEEVQTPEGDTAEDESGLNFGFMIGALALVVAVGGAGWAIARQKNTPGSHPLT